MRTSYIKTHALLLLALLFMAVGNAVGAETKSYLVTSGYAPNGSSFSNSVSNMDWDNQSIYAKIDLSGCGTTYSLQNIISFGDDIANWNSGNYNLHIYYTKSSNLLVMDYLTNGGTKNETTVTLTSTALELELSSEGLAVNGETKISASTLSGLLSLSSISVGSQQGDNRSYATYNELSLVGSGTGTVDNSTSSGSTETTSTKFVVPSYGSNYYICYGADPTLAFTVTTTSNDEQITLTTLTEGTIGQQWTAKQGNYSTTYPYHFVSVLSSKALDLAGNNTSVMPLQWTSENDYNGGSANANQEWKLVEADATAHTYYICATYNSTVYYLTFDGTSGGKLGRTTSKSSATAFGFISTSGSSGGGESGGGSSGGDSESTYDHGSFSVSWIKDQSVVGKYKEDAHATFIPYPSTAAMQADKEYYATPWVTPQSDNYILLNSDTEWKFKYVAGTTSGPGSSEFYAKNYDDSSWSTIRVPLSWEMANYGDPVYTNVGYPFVSNAPNANVGMSQYGVTDNNATGFYRRTFTVPEDWSDKRIFIHFDGVYSAAAVWVNGKFVGYSQSSNTDAEFDLTGLATVGDNQLSVRVYRWCDGSYLEGQDMWHLSGIHRDVYLVATPKVFASDHSIWASGLNSAATSGTLNAKFVVNNQTGSSATKIFSVKLLDADGNQVGSTSSVTYTGSSSLTESTAISTSISGLNGLHAWSAEDPYLYTVEVSQADANGNEEMAFSTKFGFRNITQSGKLIYINGKRVFFKGVNTQDTHPEYGRAIDVETMLKDITMMKRANVNTLRTSHYPRQPKMYAMMDAYGLYCMDEADVECHYVGTAISSNSSWQTAMNDRTTRMVLRDRNHPSVIFWSLGNECGAGTNFAGTYQICKNLDSRFVHYEANMSYSDLGSSMYPTVSSVNSCKTTGYSSKPYFICEYAHAMGQAVGNLQEYWDAIEGSSAIIGGCIWDWVDQAVYKPSDLVNGIKMKNGFNQWVAGYDYNSVSGVNYGFQGNFLDNGIITPDRAWTGKLTQVKKVYSNVTFSKSGNKITINNKNSFADLSAYNLVYQVLCDGCLTEEGTLSLPTIAAGASGTATLPTIVTDDEHEYLINVSLRLKESTLWAEAGYTVAEEQFSLTDRPSLADYSVSGGSLSVSGNTVSGTTPEGKAFSMTFSNGNLTKWTFNGQSLINEGPAFNSWRDIDNDRYSNIYFSKAAPSSGSLSKSGKNAVLTASGSGTNCSYTIAYTIYPDATVDMKVTLTPSGTTRRLGISMQFASGFENVEYYARGPWSNYVDRKTGSYLGRYVTTVDDMLDELIHPQTNGDHQDLRDLTLTNTSSNVALNIKTSGQVAFSLSHYDEQKYCGVGDTMWSDGIHWYDLTRNDNIFAHFDYWQRGLGNGSCGGDSCLNDYLCPTSNSYTYTLRFTPTAK